MLEIIENFMKDPASYEELDEMIIEGNILEKMCIKNKNTPIKTGKQGCFLGYRDENNGLPILRCPSFFEAKDIPDKLLDYFKQFKEKIKFNIIKIQKYEKGVEGITKHSDKCLDMKEGENIYIYRINKEKDSYRSLVFCEKENHNKITSFKLKNNTLLKIPYNDNKKLLHYVPKETDDNITSECYSFVFRVSDTFITDDGYVYGKGAKYKSYKERIENIKDKQKDLRSNIKDVIEMYKIENTTNILDKESESYNNVCNKIIETTL